MSSRLSPVIATTVLLFVFSAHGQERIPFKYCVRYFGSVTADLELPDTVPEYNYNGTILCPRSWSMPRVSGATLDICPPDDATAGLAIKTTLALSTSGTLDLPIDALDLQTTLITNGSVTHDFPNNGLPANLGLNTLRSEPGLPVWTVNGSRYSLVEYPSATDHVLGVHFSCNNIQNPIQYCGNYNDIHSDNDNGGCWSSQQFYWNMRSAMNYTIEFGVNSANVDIYAADEYVFPNNNGKGSGGLTRATIRFIGTPQLPSVVDYDFWRNSQQTYEVEKANLNDISLSVDVEGLPLFTNRSSGSVGEWYDSGNGTYGSRKESNGAAAARGRGSSGMLGYVTTLGLGFAAWSVIGLLF